MLGTKIVLDEEKIINEGKYDLQEIYRKIDELASENYLIKKDKYTYFAKGDSQDLSNLGIFLYDCLVEKKWFTQNIEEWKWLDGETEDDLISEMKRHNFGVW